MLILSDLRVLVCLTAIFTKVNLKLVAFPRLRLPGQFVSYHDPASNRVASSDSA
jgi:hypothetical protein